MKKAPKQATRADFKRKSFLMDTKPLRSFSHF